MRYSEVRLYTNQMGLEVVSGILLSMGITDFVTEDPEDLKDFLDKKNSYEWDYVDESVLEISNVEPNLTFYVEYSESGNQILQEFKTSLEEMKKEAKKDGMDYGRLELSVKEVCDEDWKDNWKAYFKPAHITNRIVVKPTWENYEKENSSELVIEIDPGMAFGTGTHPTTTLCVRLLEKYIESPDDIVLDVGCGSGILSMAAALLGVQTVKGVEIDPIAVDVARENVKLNHLDSQIDVFHGDLTKGLDLKADIVVANLMADLVMLLSEDVSKHLKGKGIYISSGILIEKQNQVASAIRKCGFEILEILEEDDWCAIAAKKCCK
ncbi:50S ribosomal protein L11 methyltransferase [Anaerovorax sp. IOR16]|uniref:50S ribosomal protein L11 methyltransferase n=1 Tax=Anaerovorax sp. IOR16 TaxID=2773458 RepID=UPI0019D2164B